MSATSAVDVVYPVTEPLPVLPRRPRMRDTFASLRTPNYRWYVGALASSASGAWLARLSADWLMVEVTGSVGYIAIVLAAQLLPPMALGAWGGVIGDRLSARRTIIGTQILFLVAMLMLAIPAVLGTATIGLIVASSLLVGLVAAFEGPSRAVFLVEVVGTRSLPNAMSLNATVGQVAGIVGSLLSALVIALWGAGWACALAALGPLLGIVGLLCVRRDRLHPELKVPAQRGQIREALRYVRRKPAIMLSLVLVTTVAFFQLTASILLAWSAHDGFELGPAGYSLFQAAGAVGATIGGLCSARRRALRLEHNALLLVFASLLWISLGFAPIPALFIVGLVGALGMRCMFLVGNDSLTQLSANGSIRGRVVSLYIICVTGTQAVGSLLMGWAVEQFGGRITFIISGGGPALVALTVLTVLFVRSRRAVPARAVA